MSATHAAGSGSDDTGRARIALLEDDPIIADLLLVTLERGGWQYRHFTTIAAISAALRQERFDLLILDWTLPDGEADSVIRLVNEQPGPRVPILIESGSDDEALIVDALRLGADDYVVKPLRMPEVQARVAALLRRVSRDAAPAVPAAASGVLSVGPFQVDDAQDALLLNGEPLKLTVKELELARYFLAHQNELLTRDTLLAEVWQRSPEVDTRTVDAHVSRLRRKLDLGPRTGYQIASLRGYGYRMEPLV